MGLLCEVCGKEIQESNPKEIMDGNICRNCVNKLSPWFADLEYAETHEILQQIQSREQNRQMLRQFHPTRKFGKNMIVLVDDAAKTFVVADAKSGIDANPDLVRIEDVVDCSIDVDEERVEVGDKLYQYSYVFNVVIDLDHPYLDEIRFPLNEKPLVYESSAKSFLGFGGFDPEEEPEYQEYEKLGNKIEDVLTEMEDEDEQTGEYDIGDDENPLAEKPKLVCPWCGSECTDPGDSHCPFCGGLLK